MTTSIITSHYGSDGSVIVSFVMLSVCAAIGGCSPAAAPPARCFVNADCASGTCRADGTCTAGDADATVGIDADFAADAGRTGPDGSATGGDALRFSNDSAAFTCKPDHNGTIERDELLLAANQKARFRVATGVPVGTGGVVQADGTRIWDLAGALKGDQDIDVQTESLAGRWFAGAFPTATYASRLSAGSDLLGVFRATDAELQLLGVASVDDGLFHTRVTYEPPVVVQRFPLTPNATWKTTAKVVGTAQGVLVAYAETYESTVDARGALKTPFGVFPVIRLHTRLERTVGFLTTVVHSHFFVAECYGTVASVRSADNETKVDFADAAEVRRWAP